MGSRIATGFDLEPLADGNVLVEFFGDDGKTINKQVVTPDLIQDLPFVAALMHIVLTKGTKVAAEIMKNAKLNAGKEGGQ